MWDVPLTWLADKKHSMVGLFMIIFFELTIKVVYTTSVQLVHYPLLSDDHIDIIESQF